MGSNKVSLVKQAMLAVQRYPWEQGTAMQAIYELGDIRAAVAMAHDAVLRQTEDGRLAVIVDNIAVTDPAANGEVVWRAYEITSDESYRKAAYRMLDFLNNNAPRTSKGIICHNQISFKEGFSPNQIWVDSIYMAPPFLAIMGELEQAYNQICGMMEYLFDYKSGLLNHIYDAGNEEYKASYVRELLWATGNAWALLGMARVIDVALGITKSADSEMGVNDKIAQDLIIKSKGILDNMLKWQLEDGRFHDILNDSSTFVDGASAMMMAAYIYRGVAGGWLDRAYLTYADKVIGTMDEYVDEYGIIHGVCGCPHFISEGTSAESMAAYLMMHAWADRIK